MSSLCSEEKPTWMFEQTTPIQTLENKENWKTLYSTYWSMER